MKIALAILAAIVAAVIVFKASGSGVMNEAAESHKGRHAEALQLLESAGR